MIKKDEIVTVGKFQKTHALKGELNMLSEIDSEYFKTGNPLIIETDGIFVPYYAESIRPKGNTSFLIKLSGIDSESAASAFVNKAINILKKDSEDWIEEFEIPQEELEGYTVIDAESGKELGMIKDIEDSTANLLFIVQNEKGEEIYIPANEELIEEIKDEAKQVVLKIPEGLLDINKKVISEEE